MTGIYNVRNYIDFGNMDPKCVTFGNILKQAGYATCITGKWQLGQDPELPKKFGFEEHCLWQHTRRPPRFANAGLEVNGVEKDYANGEYGPTLVNDYALDFITRKKDAPFFIYYPMILTHSPYQATPDSPDWDPKLVGERAGQANRHFGEMVEYMDKMIGRIVAKLDELGIRENTLLIFIGDNGTGKGVKSMMGDKAVMGNKGSMTHTGTHVPCIASFPGKIASGKVCSDLVDSTDFLPTLCEAAGAPLPEGLKIDGRSFWPQLKGEKGTPRDWRYCWYAPRETFEGEYAATHHFKLYSDGRFYDLRHDKEDEHPLKVVTLEGEAASAAKLLQGALDQFKGARPAGMEKPAAGQGTGKAKGKGKGKKQDE
jgi:arylsulfatase A